MQLGPDKYYKCPNCGAYLYTHTLLSGNTFGAKVYSDGKMFAPMLPEYPNITKCGGCGTILMLSRLEPFSEETLSYPQEEIAKISLWEKWKSLISGTRREAKPSPRYYECEHLSMDDLYRAIDVFPEIELYIRLMIWRGYNDRVTGRTFVYSPSEDLRVNYNLLDSKEYKSNCLALLNLLNKDNREQRMLLAELYRNLGNFKECMALIPKSDRNSYMEIECKRGNRYTVRIDNYHEMLKVRAKQEAERKEQERINEEMKDPRWKVCPNGHCYENIRKECPWCGKDNVVGRLDKDVSLQHKELYVGKQNGHYILTSDASIPMQEERIRKITIDYYQDKFVYFHIDGKNPNPFYFNTIRLNQGCIKGRMLTKYIELIMKGKCDYLDLSSCIERNN